MRLVGRGQITPACLKSDECLFGTAAAYQSRNSCEVRKKRKRTVNAHQMHVSYKMFHQQFARLAALLLFTAPIYPAADSRRL